MCHNRVETRLVLTKSAILTVKLEYGGLTSAIFISPHFDPDYALKEFDCYNLKAPILHDLKD